MTEFNHNFPNYDDDSDYTTNANSYYKDLGRKTKLIKLLAKRIWGYDEEINEYFERWEHNLDTINEDVIDMMLAWLEDGTLEQILNIEIMDRKPEIHVSEDEPLTYFENTYWYHDVGTSGLQSNIYKSNVKVSDIEPDDEQYNIWLDY